MNNDRDPLISGPPKFGWPWAPARDVNIGDGLRAPSNALDQPAGFHLPGGGTRTLPRLQRLYGESGRPAGWKVLLARLVVWAALAYHLLPAAAQWAARLGLSQDPREVLILVGGWLPTVAGVDLQGLVVPAAGAWLWQPTTAAVSAALLRLVAVNTAARDPVGAVWMAAIALGVDLATWVFMGMGLQGQAFSPAEAAALVTLFKVEGAALLLLMAVFSSRRLRTLGESGANLDRG